MSYDISGSIIRGAWQLAPGHLLGQAIEDNLSPLMDAISHGFRLFDCADIYPGVEDALGRARDAVGGSDPPLRVHTKCVPDKDRLGSVDFAEIQEIVDRSLRKLRIDCLDLVQFHWWDYRVPRYLEILQFLSRLQAAGKIRGIGLTNFDAERVAEIVEAGFNIASIQMQYSPVDRRFEAVMVPLCKAHGIKIYTYGPLLGGFLSEVWLDKPAPQLHEVQNRSLVKYRLIIDDWGGWDRYQGLLRQLKAVATRHVCSIPQVVIAALLGCARIDAVIVGLSATNYKRQNCELARKVTLSDDELRALWSWECPLAGGVYHLERTSSKHARIMRYNLNRQGDAAAGPGGA